MAISEIANQRATGHLNAGTRLSIAFPNDVTSGNLLVVLGAAKYFGTKTFTVTDSISTPYTTYSYIKSGGPSAKYWIAIGKAPSSGACTVYIDGTPAGGVWWGSIDEFTGQDPTTPLHTDGGHTLTAQTTTPSCTVAGSADDLILGIVSVDGTGGTADYTVGANYTQIGEEQNVGDFQGGNSEFWICTGDSPYTVDWTGPDVVHHIYRIAVKPATGGASASLVVPAIGWRGIKPLIAM